MCYRISYDQKATFGNGVQSECARKCHILFKGHYFCSGKYPNVAKIGKCSDCDMLNFIDKKALKPFPIEMKFSTYFQNGSFTFKSFLRVRHIILHFLIRSDLMFRLYREKLWSNKAVFSMVSITAIWVARAKHFILFNPTTTVEGKMYHHDGMFSRPKQIKHSYALVCFTIKLWWRYLKA